MRATRAFDVLIPSLILSLPIATIAAPASSGRTTLQEAHRAGPIRRISLQRRILLHPWVSACIWAGPIGWGGSALAKAVSDPRNSFLWSIPHAEPVPQPLRTVGLEHGESAELAEEPGFDVQYTPQNNHYISAEGTAAQAQAAFGVAISTFNFHGKTLRAPASDVVDPQRDRRDREV